MSSQTGDDYQGGEAGGATPASRRRRISWASAVSPSFRGTDTTTVEELAIPLLGSSSLPRPASAPTLHRQPASFVTDKLVRPIRYAVKHVPVLSLIPAVALAVTIWRIDPASQDLPPSSMPALAVFVAIIVAVLSTPYDLTTLVWLGISVLSVANAASCQLPNGSRTDCRICLQPGQPNEAKCTRYTGAFSSLLEGYVNHVNWLVLSAFHIGKAVESSGLGRRMSLLLVKKMSGSIFSIGWAICLAEYFLAMLIPSNTARGGGVIMPVVLSIIHMLDSSSASETGNRTGGDSGQHDNEQGSTVDLHRRARSTTTIATSQFLILVASHANMISAAMHITGTAANPVILHTAQQVLGKELVNFTYLDWAIGGVVPGLLCMLFMQLIVAWYTGVRLFASEGNSALTERLSRVVEREMRHLGPFSGKEKRLTLVLLVCLVLWSSEQWTGLDASMIAFIGPLALILLQVLSTDDVMSNSKAWDTFFWLGGFIALSNQLTYLGITERFGNHLSTILPSSIYPLLASVAAVYLTTMYVFSSVTGHILALVGPMMHAASMVTSAAGAGVLAGYEKVLIGIFAYLSGLSGCLTYYSSGPVVIYYSHGFVSGGRWLAVGATLGLVYLGIIITAGFGWWKVLGWT